MWIIIAILGGIAAVCFGILVVLGLRLERTMNKMIKEGDRAIGWLVQANVALFEKGDEDDPALVLISPDPATERNEALMTGLAKRIMELKGVDPEECEDEDDAIIAAWMSDETYVHGQRRELPNRFSRGKKVYLADVFILRAHLPGGRLQGPWIPCALRWDQPGTVICSRPAKPKKKKVPNEEAA